MCVLSIKVPLRKKSGNVFNDPCNLFAHSKNRFSNCYLTLLIIFDINHFIGHGEVVSCTADTNSFIFT